jgi:hypothetical protein
VLIEDGDYRLTRTLDIAADRVTIRGASGQPGAVTLRGVGMTRDGVGVAVSVSASDATIADVTIRDVGYHAVQVRGERGAARFVLHNARLLDAGQQLLKVSVSSARRYADDGVVACSMLEYTTSAPSSYTNGVDVLAGQNWIVRDNTLRRIRGPEAGGWASGPAILAWVGATGTTVERNLIVDSYRGIAFGLLRVAGDLARDGDRSRDHGPGVIRQNVLVNRHAWADDAIEVNGASGVRVEHNTVLAGGTGQSIGVRWPSAQAVLTNNLTTRPAVSRDGGRIAGAGNVSGAEPSWFIDLAALDLRLTTAARAIDAGVPMEGIPFDFARLPRVVGRAPDAGAFEWQGR